MKFTKLVTVASLLLTTISAPILADTWDTTLKVGIGSKALESEWERFDEHDSVGFMLDLKHQDYPVSIAIDAFGTGKEIKEDGDKTGVYSAELDLGLRYTYEDFGAVQPYLGGGVALGYGNIEVEEGNQTIEVEDHGTGYWVAIGAQFEFSNSVVAGIDVRQSSYDVDLDGDDYDAGGKQVTFFVGYQW
ncbi:porin family protein [Psychrosphaera sp. B3R10]|uniref:outer membrane beta-barrel protein n=1 Tax=unclassified Psychrosphaera TaxID=2641570 RepID=UPI001C0A3D37|nr:MULTISPECIES: outer membrane beta-barrel protein [unclassified Psychrosphaera]MBU2881865.1 porin family protein [Psychrosphaera sp. I2R16]MBU2989886.1 porin family protein [Psychrosphaera sp. B3R10]MDO6720938.1 outer membrane beta-barrel protein [Psychrosphaera sp. 1_MG-2023]